MPALAIRRTASLDSCSICQSNPPASTSKSPRVPSLMFRKQQPIDACTGVVRSDGIDFVMDKPLMSPPPVNKSFTSQRNKIKKPLPAAVEKQRFHGLLPAFGHRSRSESCGGTIEAVAPRLHYSTPPATIAEAAVHHSPTTPVPAKPVRPRMVRKASSVGDLADLAKPPANDQSTPRLSHIEPRKRLESLKYAAAPYTPDSAGRAVFRSAPAVNVSLPLTPPLTPSPSTTHAKRMAQPQVTSPSPLRAFSRKMRIRSRSGANSMPVFPKAVTSGQAVGLEIIIHTQSGPQTLEVNLADLESSNVIFRLKKAANLDLKCEKLPPVDLMSEEWQVSFSPQSDDSSSSPCQTPLPPTITTFVASPPSLCSSLSPSSQTSSRLTPEPHLMPCPPTDLFWNQVNDRPMPSWSLTSVDEDDMHMSPPTPKRQGFILPDRFDIKAISPDLRQITPPHPKHGRESSAQSRLSRKRISTEILSSDEEEEDWHAYNGFLEESLVPTKLDLKVEAAWSNLAKRRVGSTAAQGLHLGFKKGSFTPSDQSVTSNNERSRWSETEDEQLDSDSVFSFS